jgi:hypothetical protein
LRKAASHGLRKPFDPPREFAAHLASKAMAPLRKPLSDRREEARQQALTGHLALVALTLSGLLYLVLAVRYLDS